MVMIIVVCAMVMGGMASMSLQAMNNETSANTATLPTATPRKPIDNNRHLTRIFDAERSAKNVAKGVGEWPVSLKQKS